MKVRLKNVKLPVFMSSDVGECRRPKKFLMWWSECILIPRQIQTPYLAMNVNTNPEFNEFVITMTGDQIQSEDRLMKMIEIHDEYLTPFTVLKLSQTYRQWKKYEKSPEII